MTSDPKGAPDGDAITPDSEELVVPARSKARKKKSAKVAEAAAPQKVTEAASKPAKAKPAKKSAAKDAQAVEPPMEALKTEKPARKKSAKKKAKPAEDAAISQPVTDAAAGEPADTAAEDAADTEPVFQKEEEPKLERLQKILAKAGISSRRKAEELILGGRVQINGKVIMELGTKADPARDHVRVDGKLLQGPERIRYFVLNKPKGFVTTVSDPEGRPTAMQFFAGEHERLYPVGRLDYLSEGLLLVTNDGELANKLTKAASGVEKTYLVKVAGQPAEAALDALRSGVVIERGRGVGSGRVRTAPAQIRQVRQGENPWYEVIVIEGRNRELRKMFEEIGHHVEKIRRVGYGPLVLDLEPGKLRELEAEEVHSLRLAAEGKLKTKRRRGPAAAQLPTVAGKTVRYKKADGKPGFEPRARTEATPEFRPRSGPEFRPTARKAVRPEFQQESKSGFNPAFRPQPKREFKPELQPASKPDFRSEVRKDARPEIKREFKPAGRPGVKSAGRPAFGGKPRREEPPVTDYVLPPRKGGPLEPEDEFNAKAAHPGPGFNPDYKPGFRTGSKPAFRTEKPGGKPAFRAGGPPRRFGAGTPNAGGEERRPSRPAAKRPDFAPSMAGDEDYAPSKTPGFRIDPVPASERPRAERTRSAGFGRTAGSQKPFRPRPAGMETGSGRPAGEDRPLRPRSDGPAANNRGFRPPPNRGSDRSQSAGRGTAREGVGVKPFRPATNRPASGKFLGSGPDSRPDSRPGSRPPSKARSFRPNARPESATGSERPARFTPRKDGPPLRRNKPFGATEDRPREYRPRVDRTGDGAPRKFGPAKSSTPGAGNKSRTGGGEPRTKERWRNSFTGKNKGRPKPKPKTGE